MSKAIPFFCLLTLAPLLTANEEFKALQTSIQNEHEAIEELRQRVSEERTGKEELILELQSLKRAQSEEIAALVKEIDAQLAQAVESDSDFEDEGKVADYQKYRPDTDIPGFYLKGDFLYWKTLEGNVDFAVQDQPVSLTETGAIGKIESGKFGGDPGVRLALGLRFPPDNWESELSWTYFHNTGKQTIHAPILTSSSALVGTFHQTTGARIVEAKSALDIKFNTLDLALAKRYLPWDQILMRFFTAISGAWIHQDWQVQYLSTVNNDEIKMDWQFHAGGIRGGFSLDWLLGWGFGIVTRLAGGGYVGSYHNQVQYREQTSLDAINTLANSHFDDTRFVFNVQYQLGLNWGWTFENDSNVNLFVGYEVQPWFNLHEVNRALFNTSYNSRDTRLSSGVVTPQGLTISAEYNF